MNQDAEYFLLASGDIHARHNKICVISKFKNAISLVDRMQVGRCYDIKRWS